MTRLLSFDSDDVEAICASLSEMATAPLDRIWRAVTLSLRSRKIKEAMMLMKPMAKTITPAPMTILQKGMPRFSWLVASLLRLPRRLLPMTIMPRPRKLKPCELLRTGQLRSNHRLNTEHSEVTRNMLDRAVMTCVAPSKKKN